MIKLSTAYGTLYLFEASDKLGDRLLAVGPPYTGTQKYKTPTRPVYTLNGDKIYIGTDEENVRALVGDAFVPDAVVPKKKKKRVMVEVEDE